MKVAARLALAGVALPAVGLVGAFAAQDRLFERSLHQRLDEALLQQAAVESVSLFDGPEGYPHLHLSESPLAGAVRAFAPTGAIYGPDGARQLRYPDTAWSPETVSLERSEQPRLRTVLPPGGTEERELLVTVVSPDDERAYTLRLAASLEPLRATMAAQRRVAGEVGAGLLLVLLAVQLWQARGIALRLRRLAAVLPDLREGSIEARLPHDGSGDEISELRDALAEAGERLRAARDGQERLLANAAHELRTPLTLMRTEFDLALRKERSAAELRAALAEARSEVDRLAALSSSLLDFAALGKVTWSRAEGDLAGVVAEAVDGFRSEAELRGVLLRTELPERASAPFDRPALRQAIDNLLSNALKFAPKESAVTVRLQRNGAAWRVLVEDQGPGVPEAEREWIFEPFHRVLAAGGRPGAGLGLAIVREIARRHGGTARLVPSERGASFAVELPDAPPAPRVAEVVGAR